MKENVLPKATVAEFDKLAEWEGKGILTPDEDLQKLKFLNSYEWSSEIFVENGKTGVRDVLGKVLVPPLFDDVHAFFFAFGDPSIVSALSNGKWGLVAADGNGTSITGFLYDMVYPIAGPLVVVKNNGKYGYIQSNGDLFSQIEFDQIIDMNDWFFFVNGLSLFIKDGKYGITDGFKITKPIFDDIDPMETLVLAKIGELEGYIDENGCLTEDEDKAYYMSCLD